MNPTEFDILELLQKVRRDEPHALVDLLERYKPIIESNVTRYAGRLEEDEIRQLSAIGLYEAASSFSPDKVSGNVTFGLYAKVCIHNRLISELRRMSPVTDEVEDGALLSREESPEERLIRIEELESTFNMALKKLTPYETRVFKLYLSGDSYDSIAEKLGKPKKSVDNAMSRVRSKFREKQ